VLGSPDSYQDTENNLPLSAKPSAPDLREPFFSLIFADEDADHDSYRDQPDHTS
jgi:hypothetical protein